ncbi:MAG: HD domain-containing phosphohydrolase [Candidatus Omnitrophota bacterium]
MENCRIFLINDDKAVAECIRERLNMEGGYQLTLAADSLSGLKAFEGGVFDIAILKFNMPVLGGLGLLEKIKKHDPDCIIIVFIEDASAEDVNRMLAIGVYDFITQPVNLDRLMFIIRKGSQLRSLKIAHRNLVSLLGEQNVSLKKQNTHLAARIEESTKNLTRLYEDLRETYMRTMKALAQAIDARDHYTHSHSENVAKYAMAIVDELRLSNSEKELIRDACELHDLGKIGVEDAILSKPTGLTEAEWKKMKLHPFTGAQILEPLTFLNGAIALVKQHHEHYDGSGYPEGLKGEDILLGARIINVADAYDAMHSPRSYRQVPLTKQEAIVELKKNSGTQFDPKIVEAFLKALNKFE